MTNKKNTKEYTIGLDIGTNSVGWAVVLDDYKVPSKKMKVLGNTDKSHIKKNLLGSLLFTEGETALNRRLKRNNRRRLNRRRQRLLYLQDIFESEMQKQDPNFFHRLDESFLSESDKQNDKHPIFAQLKEEKEYHEEYPTIYHLRKHLADSKEKADIRLIYLALAHIIKFRGHFLHEGNIDIQNISVTEKFKSFLETYNTKFETDLRCDMTAAEEVFKEKLSKTKKIEKLITLFEGENKRGKFAEFLKLILGNSANIKKAFNLDTDVKLQIPKDTYDSDLEEVLAIIGQDYADLFDLAKQTHDSVVLANILNITDQKTNALFSAAMVQRYNEHKEDLKRFKQFIKSELPQCYYSIFKDKNTNGYAGYIDSDKPKVTSEADFYKFLKGILPKNENSNYFLEKIEQENFLRKQRTFDNGSIPNQIHLAELEAIIGNQSVHYPFLKENADKIKQILTFRIPYYVGPLAKGNSDFAWMVRKGDQPIRPWNFNEMVDKDQSATKFIERMTSKDIYLPQEKVLPRHSFLYEKFTVYNELTKVTFIDDREERYRFSKNVKQNIFDNLFKKYRKVSEKRLLNYLNQEYPEYRIQHIDGLNSTDKGFNASLSSYHDLLKILGKDFMDNKNNESIIEKIIYILTIFEDKEIIEKQLSTLSDSLTKEQIKKLTRRHYTGWGKVSKKLIAGIRNKENQKTILDYLIDDGTKNRNFMQLIKDKTLSFVDIIDKAQEVKPQSFYEMVDEIAGNPAIKKGILQSLKIVDEITAVMGGNPQNIVIEMARENQTTAEGIRKSKRRFKKLSESLKSFGSDLIKEQSIEEAMLSNEKIYLYCLQNGKDIYTGEALSLDLNSLNTYDIDHIIPQSFITDNSFDNRVLTKLQKNRGKLDNVPSIEVVKKMKPYWQKLYDAKLMSNVKFNYLTKAERGGLKDEDKQYFIKRQLVETRQITKHVARILDAHFNDKRDGNTKTTREVQILTLKSSLVHQFRSTFGLYKIRNLNNYHHAHDAYLNAVVGRALLGQYPHLASEFVYGEFRYQKKDNKDKATEKKHFYSNVLKFMTSSDIVADENGNIVWNKDRHIAQIKKVLSFPQVNVVKRVERQTGAFSKETIKPRSNSSNLIKRKNNWATEIYGGFDSPNMAYLVLVIAQKENPRTKKYKSVKEFVGIRVMDVDRYEKNPIAFLEMKGYQNIERDKLITLPKYSLLEFENGRRRLLSGEDELQKGNELVIPSYLVTLLHHAQKVQDSESVKHLIGHRHQFDELLAIIKSFSAKNIKADKNWEKIEEVFGEHRDDDITVIARSFVNLLTFVRLGAPTDFDFFGEKIARSRYKIVKECLNSTLIQQSLTGLYETRTDLGRL